MGVRRQIFGLLETLYTGLRPRCYSIVPIRHITSLRMSQQESSKLSKSLSRSVSCTTSTDESCHMSADKSGISQTMYDMPGLRSSSYSLASRTLADLKIIDRAISIKTSQKYQSKPNVIKQLDNLVEYYAMIQAFGMKSISPEDIVKLISHDKQLIRWKIICLLMEKKQLSPKSILDELKVKDKFFISISHSTTKKAAFDKLVALLKDNGACEDTLRDISAGAEALPGDVSSTIEKAMLLMKYLNTPAEALATEISCVHRINLDLLVTEWTDVLHIGLKYPNEILTYLTGHVVPSDRRSLSPILTFEQFTQFLKLDQNQLEDLIKVKHQVMSYILRKQNGDAIQDVYEFLIRSGYLPQELAQVPFIFAFKKKAIEDVMNNGPSNFKSYLQKAENNIIRLRLIFAYLDREKQFHILMHGDQRPVKGLPVKKQSHT